VSGPKRRIAWRVLDAQYFTLAQRRERLFLIASPGNGTDPAKILFEYDGMRGNPPARRRTTQDVAGTVEASSAQSRGAGINPGELVTCGTLTHGRNAAGSATQQNALGGLLIPEARFACAEDVTQALTCGLGRGGPDDNKAQAGFYIVDRKADNSTAPTVTSHPYNDNISHEDGLIATAFNGAQDPVVSGEISGPCGRNAGQDTCIAFTERTRSSGRTLETQDDLAYALTNPGSGGRTHSRQVLDRFSAVRRLTPRECERLQGFPDDYTLIPYARKPAKRMDEDLIAYYMRGGRITFDECLRAAKDAPRYKAIGNSKPTNVIRWILLRIEYWYFKQQSYCPAWCPCLSSNIKMRHGTEICFETQMKYAVKYRAQEDVKKNYSVSQM
jgi:DNA (cytosine-5)-methyltransferase 1